MGKPNFGLCSSWFGLRWQRETWDWGGRGRGMEGRWKALTDKAETDWGEPATWTCLKNLDNFPISMLQSSYLQNWLAISLQFLSNLLQITILSIEQLHEYKGSTKTQHFLVWPDTQFKSSNINKTTLLTYTSCVTSCGPTGKTWILHILPPPWGQILEFPAGLRYYPNSVSSKWWEGDMFLSPGQQQHSSERTEWQSGD